MTVKVGGKAALTFGGGAGAGGEVEISRAKLLKDPRAAGRCALEGFVNAAKKGVEVLCRTSSVLMRGSLDARAEEHEQSTSHVVGRGKS